jgi:hypothetical protein
MELPGEPWKRKGKKKMPSSCQGDKGEDKEVSYFKFIKIANCTGFSEHSKVPLRRWFGKFGYLLGTWEVLDAP